VKILPALRFLGRLVLLLAAAQLLPLGCALLYGEREAAIAFAASAAISAALGATLAYGIRAKGELYRREGILIVVGGWVLASILGAVPYLLAGTFGQPMDALFESASGFTTTGATVMIDIETAGRAVLFWRSFTQWLGGVGIIVFFVALLPELGPGARFLYKLEVPGPNAEALTPRIRDTAVALCLIYLVLTAAEALLLYGAGLDLYDALTHTFSTLSTGGFSPRAASVAAFDSPVVSVIVIVFMILAGTNFSLFYLMTKRGWRALLDPEFRLYINILAVAIFLVAWDLLRTGAVESGGSAVLHAAFQATSILTTTGFSTADFNAWPALSRMVIVLLMFVGGCAGSTAGSMKVMRMSVGLRSAFREVRLMFSPNAVLSIFVGGKPVPNPVVRSVAGFFILYLSSWGLGSLCLSFGEADLVTASTAAAATLGNIGPGLGLVGPIEDYAFFGAWEKGIMVLLMWLGRLEVYSIAALATRAFWKS